MKLACFLLRLSAFLAGFGVTAFFLSASMPPIRVSHLSQKLDWLAAHPRDYDVLIVGSSRVRQIIPAVLDAEFAAAGMPLRTFNLSADGMRPPEDSYVLDQALSTRRAPFKFIIIEANPIPLRISDEDRESARLLHWHDTPRILAIWKRALSHSTTNPPSILKWLPKTLEQMLHALDHSRFWLWKSVRHGAGAEVIERRLSRTPSKRRPEIGLGALNDGYIPPKVDAAVSGESAKSYERSLKKKLKEGSQLDPMDPVSQDQVRRAANLARQFGAKLVVVAPPSVTVKTFQPLVAATGDCIFIDLSDPVSHPELFAPQVRRDGSHLTQDGAALFTKLIAKHLIASARKSECEHQK